MGNGRYVRIRQGPYNPLGNLSSRLSLAVMHTGHDPVGLSQDIVGEIESTFFQNIDFNSFEHGEITREQLV